MLARHPSWTPDEVKGALMLSAAYLPNADWQAAGVGEVDGRRRSLCRLRIPPNPNENLDTFVGTDPSTGQPMFDSAAWASAVSSDAAWSSAAWASAAWSSAVGKRGVGECGVELGDVELAGWSSAMSSAVSYSEATYSP